LLDCLRLNHLPGWEGTTPHPRFDYLSEEARRNREELRRRGGDVITEEQAIEVKREVDNFMASHTRLLREIFGNPFRPVSLNPTWHTTNVLALVQAIYDDRAFERMPILGDALEDAGCDNADILNHCRQPGEHVRGCWVVDLILGKS
jgi:hypothetical protein